MPRKAVPGRHACSLRLISSRTLLPAGSIPAGREHDEHDRYGDGSFHDPKIGLFPAWHDFLIAASLTMNA
jgi:hypothetical protein